jgi:hypothetical protein
LNVTGNSNLLGNVILGIANLGNTYIGGTTPVNVIGSTTTVLGVVNPLTLVDGSVLLSNTPPLDFSNNYGTVWTPTAISKNWQAVAMSASGQYQTAVINNGLLYISSNYGVTWTSTATTRNLASRSNVGLRSISNGGSVWWCEWIHLYFQQLRCDVDIHRHISGVQTWRGVAVSASGQYQTAGAYNGFLYISSNYGVTWTSTAASRSWYGVAVSASGQYQTAVVYSGTVGYIYISTNYGATWAQQTNTPQQWQAVAMSASGQYQTAVVYSGTVGYIYISTNYGATWAPQTTTPQNWQAVAMSASGQYQTAGCTMDSCIFPPITV